jgi:hypothetical protein
MTEFTNTLATDADTLTIAKIADVASPIFNKYPAIEKAWLFGFFARQEQHSQSDIDFSLSLDKTHKFSLFDLSHLGIDLEHTFSKSCDIVTGDVKYKSMQHSINKDKVLIYER